MYYFASLIVFTLAIVFIVFSNESFINKEMDHYQKIIQQPWLNRFALYNI